mmetsp:Transcript_19893/g.64606  ORF Transcript_19893/g.64606 Transcript_19893/m.64606 type:complete len:237 (-) Transcript_19893:77-787(-)
MREASEWRGRPVLPAGRAIQQIYRKEGDGAEARRSGRQKEMVRKRSPCAAPPHSSRSPCGLAAMVSCAAYAAAEDSPLSEEKVAEGTAARALPAGALDAQHGGEPRVDAVGGRGGASAARRARRSRFGRQAAAHRASARLVRLGDRGPKVPQGAGRRALRRLERGARAVWRGARERPRGLAAPRLGQRGGGALVTLRENRDGRAGREAGRDALELARFPGRPRGERTKEALRFVDS